MQEKHTIRLNNQLVHIDTPLIMGILNTTPDSFYAESRVQSTDIIHKRVRQMTEDGVDIIDIGGYSSRPGASHISIQEEKQRLEPALDVLASYFPSIPVSVDTFRAEVAHWAIDKYNVTMINDISAGRQDPEILPAVARQNVAYVGMHMRGTPLTMQAHTQYDDIMREIILYFSELQEKAALAGINDLIIDPGFGFAKTKNDNFMLLNRLREFTVTGLPVLVGVSRKSMIYKHLNIRPEDSMPGTITLNTIALTHGASIIRVHDVKPAVEMVKLTSKTLNSKL